VAVCQFRFGATRLLFPRVCSRFLHSDASDWSLQLPLLSNSSSAIADPQQLLQAWPGNNPGLSSATFAPSVLFCVFFVAAVAADLFGVFFVAAFAADLFRVSFVAAFAADLFCVFVVVAQWFADHIFQF